MFVKMIPHTLQRQNKFNTCYIATKLWWTIQWALFLNNPDSYKILWNCNSSHHSPCVIQKHMIGFFLMVITLTPNEFWTHNLILHLSLTRGECAIWVRANWQNAWSDSSRSYQRLPSVPNCWSCIPFWDVPKFKSCFQIQKPLTY